jgi:hypothetical protein
MFQKRRSPCQRKLRPTLDALEERALLHGALPHAVLEARATPALVRHLTFQASQGSITILNTAISHGYFFVNLDGPSPGTTAGTGTNLNGISNNNTVVGFTIANDGSFLNFVARATRNGAAAKILNINGSTAAQAFGVNSAGSVVGTDGNGSAFVLTPHGGLKTFIPSGGSVAVAFGINDRGMIAGQSVVSESETMPGFLLVHGGTSFVTANAPSGSAANFVNAQGVNNRGLVVGFYVGNDGEDHGFIADAHASQNGALTGTAIADPVIPPVSGEPGATFVFSQVLGVNDHGIAVGYYGDSTTSQHGFFYNTRTGNYRFLDDPNAAFNDGVEVTQITGITNSGTITGFYSDANGVFHGFVATPLPNAPHGSTG